MLAILILAGRSRRFWPLEEKSFFPIAGTTLVAEQTRRLNEAGIDRIVLVAGAHNHAQTVQRFPALTVIEQEDLDLGMRGALLSALPACGKDPVLVVSANDLIDASAYRTLLERSAEKPSGGLILSRKVTSYFPGGYLVQKGARITDIVEKPGKGAEPSSLVNIVAHVHRDPLALLAALRRTTTANDDGYEMALRSLFAAQSYDAVPYEGPWHAVKYPWHLLLALESLLPQDGEPRIDPSASVHPSAVIEGPVFLSAGVRILPHATVRGPCVIGRNTIIANNTLVRGSSIGENCVIGYNTEVARSILADDVWTHSSYIGDSVVGSRVSFGAGTTAGNLRLDEGEISSVVSEAPVETGLHKLGVIVGNDCRTGIHTCFAPGIKVGCGSFINSMTLVTEDVPDHSFATMDQRTLSIRKNKVVQRSPGGREHFRKKL